MNGTRHPRTDTAKLPAAQVMPFAHGGLGGDQGGFAPIAFLDDFEQVEALLVGEAVGSKVVEDEQLRAGEFVDGAREAAI